MNPTMLFRERPWFLRGTRAVVISHPLEQAAGSWQSNVHGLIDGCPRCGSSMHFELGTGFYDPVNKYNDEERWDIEC